MFPIQMCHSCHTRTIQDMCLFLRGKRKTITLLLFRETRKQHKNALMWGQE